jgi:hypothetical protein
MCGIGGRTIAEAQHRVSYREFLSWALYRSKRGSLNIGMRVEHGAGLLSAIYANSKSKDGGYRVHDFAPHHEEPEMTLEQAMESWK